MAIIGLVVSLLALFLAGFTYFKHDKSLKQQAALINKYQIDKNEKDIEESKKAIIEAKYSKKKPGNGIIKIHNKGKSTARSVNVIIPSTQGIEVINGPCSRNILRPDHSFKISITIDEGYSDKIIINFEWNDDFQEGNQDSQELQIL